AHLDQGGLANRWVDAQGLGMGSQFQAPGDAFLAAAILGVVKLAKPMGLALLELAQTRPSLQKAPRHGPAQIASTQFDGLGKIPHERSPQALDQLRALSHPLASLLGQGSNQTALSRV